MPSFRVVKEGSPTAPHKATHATGGSDALTPADIGAAPSAHNHDAAYVNETDHTKAAHDALLIDAATLDGIDSTGFKPASYVPGWAEVTGKPATFPPDAHNHDTLYAAIAHVGSRNGHPLATTALDGLMAGADKTKLGVIGNYARVERRANQATGTASAWYTVSWDTEITDAPGYFDAANPTRLTLPVGRYEVSALSVWSTNATGIRAARIQLTSGAATTDVVNGPVISAAVDNYGRVPVVGSVDITAAGDYLTMDCFHSSGAALTLGRNAVAGLPELFIAVLRIS